MKKFLLVIATCFAAFPLFAQNTVTLDANLKVRNAIVNFGAGNTVDFTGATVDFTGATLTGIAPASDTAFASSWNGVTTVSPSKNAVYDWAHIFDTDDDGKVNVLDQGAGIPLTDANGVLLSPITDNSSNWNMAYTDRLKWDGGATGLVPATGRTSLELGTLATQNGTFSGTSSGTNTGDQDLSGYQTKTGTLALAGFSSITGRIGDANLPLGAQLSDNAGTPILAANFATRQLLADDGTTVMLRWDNNDGILLGTGGIFSADSGTWFDNTGFHGSGSALTGVVTSVSGTAPIVSSGGATPAISISASTTGAPGSMSAADKTKLDAITGTNTGDNAVNSLYSGLVSNATHTGDVTGATALTLATAQPAVHTWALAQTFTVAPVFTDQSGSRTALGLGTLATQSGTFSGTSSGTNTGDQTIPVVSDTAYDTTSWNANLDAPSKNAVRDKFESLSFGSGTVTSFSAGDLSPLFSTIEATATTTPALTFALSNAAAHTIFGNFTGSSGAPSYNALGTGVDTFLTTPSSANLLAAATDETGTGALVFANTPTLVTPNIGVATGASLALTLNQDAASNLTLANTNAGTSSQANLQVLSDSVNIALKSHATARVATRYGTALGGYSEILTANGGLMIGTGTTNAIIIFGTNSAEQMRLDTTRVSLQVPARVKVYTVATLPSGAQGDTAAVSDATGPTYLGTLTGGGAVFCPVVYNGAAWVSH